MNSAATPTATTIGTTTETWHAAQPPVTLITSELDGKRIGYSSETKFFVQVGKGSKGSYRNRYVFKGNLATAVMHYNMINIGRGYKKRLIMDGSPKPLAKAAS